MVVRILAYKMMKIFFLIWITNFVSAQFPGTVIDFYENLITDNIQAAESYQPPTNSNYFRNNSTSEEILDYGTFDFIIVGAGSAGSVLANRLTENPNWNILLLEAGKYENAFSDIPAMGPAGEVSEMDWGYFSVSQNNCCLSSVERRCPVPRGKGLGGSSAINGMLYSRGNRADYNKWEKLGNDGWSYQDVLPYFLKSENSYVEGDPRYHNIGGLLNVQYVRLLSPLAKTTIRGYEELGLMENDDYNGRKQLGLSRPQATVVNGVRDSTAKAFLAPVANRKNLHIITNTLVLQILIKSKIAYGVKFILNGQFYTATVKNEVILSAGSINSPQLLMLSGVGPKNHLEEKGVKVVHDLRGVGQNLLEHPAFSDFMVEFDYVEPVRPLRELVFDYLRGENALTVFRGNQLLSFIQVDKAKCKDYPDVEIAFSYPTSLNISVPSLGTLNQETLENFSQRVNAQTTLLMMVILLHPKARGTVSLASNSPFDYPDVDLKSLSQREDVETLYKGVKDCLRLIRTEEFRKLNARLLKYHLPACGDFEYLSKDYWICTIEQISMGMRHLAGTCKMGPPSDGMAVVDNKLRVYGIGKLRVVDASTIPVTISGHTNAPTIMIAEKISDVIKKQYM